MHDKKFYKFAFVLIILTFIAGIIIFFLTHAEWKDRFGFTHNITNNKTYENDVNQTRDYAIVELDKSILDYSDHKLIETISPILQAYSDKKYTCISFGDGTGLYFQNSNINLKAYYGEINSDGLITQSLNYYDFSDQKVIVSDVMVSQTAESKELYAAYPEDFKNDFSYGAIIDNCAYIRFYINEGANIQMRTDAANEFFNKYKENYDFSRFDTIYIDANDVNGYIVNTDGSLELDNSILDLFSEVID